MAPLSDPQRLLELLQSATDELKASHRDTAIAKSETKRLGERLAAAQAALAEAQEHIVKADTGGDVVGALQGRLMALQTELQAGQDARGKLEERVSDLESMFAAERTLAQGLDERLRANGQALAQLEAEAEVLRLRRDELNVELGQVEGDRTLARSQVSQLEADLEQQHQQLVREKDKHQHTAQKLLEERGKLREAEGQLKDALAMNVELVSSLELQAAAHSQSLDEAKQAAAQANAELTARVHELTRQLEATTGELNHTGRQYEQLHREMLTLLDQRDEARRELEVIRQRFGLP